MKDIIITIFGIYIITVMLFTNYRYISFIKALKNHDGELEKFVESSPYLKWAIAPYSNSFMIFLSRRVFLPIHYESEFSEVNEAIKKHDNVMLLFWRSIIIVAGISLLLVGLY